jgi:hypothetical protein
MKAVKIHHGGQAANVGVMPAGMLIQVYRVSQHQVGLAKHLVFT